MVKSALMAARSLSIRGSTDTLTDAGSPLKQSNGEGHTGLSSLTAPSPAMSPSPAFSPAPVHLPSINVSQGQKLRPSNSLAQRSHQLQLLGPARPQPAKTWRTKSVRILVVGDSGLGKTTLITTLLRKPGEQIQVQDATNTSLTQFRKDPESLCTRLEWKDEQDKVLWIFRMQDTPGYGDDPDISKHVQMMMDFLEKQNVKYLQQESARDRPNNIDMDDPRVDLCLYALPPHRLRGNDVRYMAELSRLVPVVPVILKADTMTIAEAQEYRREVFNRLNAPGKGLNKVKVFSFSAQALERAGVASHQVGLMPPFICLASHEVNQALLQTEPPLYWPERAYKWGVAEAFNPEHSDLLSLRALLMSEAVEEVSQDKRVRYERWRQQYLRVPMLSRMRNSLLRFALAGLLPAALLLVGQANHWDVKEVRESIKGAWSGARCAVSRRLRRSPKQKKSKQQQQPQPLPRVAVAATS